MQSNVNNVNFLHSSEQTHFFAVLLHVYNSQQVPAVYGHPLRQRRHINHLQYLECGFTLRAHISPWLRCARFRHRLDVIIRNEPGADTALHCGQQGLPRHMER